MHTLALSFSLGMQYIQSIQTRYSAPSFGCIPRPKESAINLEPAVIVIRFACLVLTKLSITRLPSRWIVENVLCSGHYVYELWHDQSFDSLQKSIGGTLFLCTLFPGIFHDTASREETIFRGFATRMIWKTVSMRLNQLDTWGEEAWTPGLTAEVS